MAGRVVSTRVPYLPITVEIPEKHLIADFTALVDTGFDAEVVVPQAAVANGVPALLYSDVRLADGSRISTPAYPGTVKIGETAIGPVLGMVMGDEAIFSSSSPSTTTAYSSWNRRPALPALRQQCKLGFDDVTVVWCGLSFQGQHHWWHPDSRHVLWLPNPVKWRAAVIARRALSGRARLCPA